MRHQAAIVSSFRTESPRLRSVSVRDLVDLTYGANETWMSRILTLLVHLEHLEIVRCSCQVLLPQLTALSHLSLEAFPGKQLSNPWPPSCLDFQH